MARLVFTQFMSLDGYVADTHGTFDGAVPDAHVHAFINDLARPHGTLLYGRRMYEAMVAWECLAARADLPPEMQDFAAPQQAAEKGRQLHAAA